MSNSCSPPGNVVCRYSYNSSWLESFMTTTTNLFALLVGSLLHDNSPPITATRVLGQLAVGGCIDSREHIAALLFTAAFDYIDSRGCYCPLLSVAVATAIVRAYVMWTFTARAWEFIHCTNLYSLKFKIVTFVSKISSSKITRYMVNNQAWGQVLK